MKMYSYLAWMGVGFCRGGGRRSRRHRYWAVMGKKTWQTFCGMLKTLDLKNRPFLYLLGIELELACIEVIYHLSICKRFCQPSQSFHIFFSLYKSTAMRNVLLVASLPTLSHHFLYNFSFLFIYLLVTFVWRKCGYQ